MIVCVCKGVGSVKIRSLIEGGARSVDEIGAACGAGTDCGSCRCAMEDMLDEHAEESAPLASLRLSRMASASAG